MSSRRVLTINPSNSGFLSGFVEASVELPDDGLNGDCTIHYSGHHSNCELHVRLVNGMREGVGTIVRDGTPFIQVEYHHGVANGSVCRMNDCGKVELRGQVINGVEQRLLLEYGKNDKVAWRGYYRNGVRYSEVVKSGELAGYHDERSVVTGILLSTAQYDKDLRDKSGRCFEYENGRVKSECVYENGVKKRTVREFVDGKMIVFDSAGKKVYEGVYYGDLKSGYLCHEPMKGMVGFFKEVDYDGQLIAVSQYDELNVYKNGKCFELENGRVKRVCLYENDKMKRLIMEFNGSTMTEYDENNRKIYEGGFKGNMKNEFMRDGKGYEMDESGEMKRGCVYENGRMKRVIQEFDGDWMIEYDNNGKKVYEGEYKGDMKSGFLKNGYGSSLNVNGKDMKCCLYENGHLVRVIVELNGNEMTEYDDNGKRMYVGEFNGDMKNGFKRNGRGYYLDENEVVKLNCVFENGVMRRVIQEFVGVTMAEYHKNGIVSYLGEYKGDMKNGFVREGKGREYGRTVLYSGEWRDGLRDGSGEEWNENGMCSIGHWKTGKKEGLFYEMDKNRRMKRVCDYENGRMKRVMKEFDGEWMIEYDSNGEKVYEGEYKGEIKNGFVRNGYGYCLNVNGKDMQYCAYDNGHLVWVLMELNGSTMTVYDENGKRRYVGGCSGDRKNGFKPNGRGYCLDENEVVIQYSTFENGVMRRAIQAFYGGIMEECHENGMMRYLGGYKGDMNSGFLRNGYGYCMDTNGKDMEFCLYEDGHLVRVLMEIMDSTMTEYDDNGKRMYVGEFGGDMKSGFKRNGQGYYLDENEVVKLNCVFENGVMRRVIQEFVGVTMTEYHENGMINYLGEYKGDLENGFVREGKGREYGADGRVVVYVGGWKNGKREGFGTELRNWYTSYRGGWSDGLRDGSGEEWNEKGMRSIGHWKTGKKEGLFYEMDKNRRMKRVCDYENGRMKRVVPEWELCHMILSRRIDSIAELPLDPSSFSVSDIQSGRTVGVFQLNRKYCSVYWFNDTLQSVVVDMDSKEMIVYVNNEQIDTQCSMGLIDLDVNGRRWEGGVKDGIPFGYGVLYDEEGRKEYEGFMMDGMKVCYGFDYYSDIGIVKYEGCYCNNEYCGKGVLCNRNGWIDYYGLWKNNVPYWPSYYGYTIDYHIGFINVPNNSYNELESFVFHSFIHLLKWIVIGNDCFGSVRLFELDGLIEMESVVIGQKSLTVAKTKDDIWYHVTRTDGSFRIVNCPNLKFIWIGDHSFGDYHSFELSNLPSLQFIDIGQNCFNHTPSFSLTDLRDLQSVKLGMNTFFYVHSVVFEDLPKLQSIQLGREALAGDDVDDRKTISKPPYNYKNTLTMRNLPSLTEFKGYGDRNNFHNIGSVFLENIPQLESGGIRFGYDCFEYTYSIQSSGTHCPNLSSFDATALENYLNFGNNTPSSTSYVVKNPTELNSIPLDVEDLWIGCFDTSGMIDISFSSFQSLETLVIGNRLFREVTSFELKSLPFLQSVNLGEYAFFYVQSVVFENLPRIQSIQLGDGALAGDWHDDRKTIDEAPYNYKNTLTMRNLPSLTTFKGDGWNFRFIGSVILENIPVLLSNGITFDDHCFEYTYSLQSSSTVSLLSSSFDVALESFIRNKWWWHSHH